MVSIVIPVFNGADFVAEAVESALAQSWPETEVIVVDDGSDDGGATQRAVALFGDSVRLIAQPNGGVAAALNTGIAAMRGDWFAWLSHDDLYHPERIARHVTALMARPVPMVSFGDADQIDRAGRFLGRARHTDGFADDGEVGNGIWAVLEGRLNGCTMIVPRRSLEEAGGFDPGLPTTQDYALWHRLALRHPFLPVPGALVRQRQHGGQGSRMARHIEEASLLWVSLLEHLESLGGTPADRLRRLRRAGATLRHAPYHGARRFLEARLRSAMGAFGADLVVRRPAGPDDVARAMRLVLDAGLRPGRVTVTDERHYSAPALSVECPGTAATATVVRTGEHPSAALLLEAALGSGEERLSVILDAQGLPPGAELVEGLRAVAAGASEAWIAPPGPGLCAAVFDRDALKAAYAGPAANAAATAAVLARLGRTIGPSDVPPAPALPRSIPRPPVPAPLRMHIADRPVLARMPDPRRPTILMLLHDWGGGTLRYVETLGRWLGERVNLLYGWGVDERLFRLGSQAPDIAELEWDVASEGLDAPVMALRALGVERVHVLHTIGFDRWIEDFLDAMAVPFDVTLLDYHLVANGAHLTDEDGRFVGDAALEDPDHPARRRGPPRLLLRKADRRIACSRDLAWRAGRLSGGLPIIAAQLPEPGNPRNFAIQAPDLADGEALRVLCLGRLAPHKGIEDIAAVARLAEARGLKLQLLCLGEDLARLPVSLQSSGTIRLLGGFAEEMLNPLVCELRPHLAWLPFRAPETHSFALSDCMLLGLPILATGVGAIPERVEGRPSTWLMPPEQADPRSVVTWFETLVRDRMRTAPRWLPTGHLPAWDEDFYARSFLR
nr:glycosyltransferase [Neoroseomonas eburnea]